MAVLMGLIGQAMASWHREGRDRMRNGDSTGESGLATPRAPLNEPRLAGWIGRSIRVEGKVVSTEDLTIDGHVKGSIKLGDHSLTIGPSATIRADLVAKNVTISGAVTGKRESQRAAPRSSDRLCRWRHRRSTACHGRGSRHHGPC